MFGFGKFSGQICKSEATLYVMIPWHNHVYYEGRPINKLQNGAILSLLNIGKIRNIRFVGNLILSKSCEFYYDDVTVTSFVNDKCGDTTAESIP